MLLISAPWQARGAELDEVIALTGATIETAATAGRIERGTVVLQGNKIEAVGAEVEIPERARIISIQGCTVIPGVIDPYYAIRVGSAGETPPARTVIGRGRRSRGTTTRTVPTQFTQISENFYPYNLSLRPLLRSGITVLNITTTGNGQAALANNTPQSPREMLFEPQGVLFASVTNETTSLDLIRNGLRGSQRERGGSSSGGPRGSSRSSGRGTSSRSSSRLTSAAQKLWAEVASGKRALIVNASNAATILHLFDALESNRDVRLTLIATGQNVFYALEKIKAEAKKRTLSLILPPSIDEKPNTTEQICVPRLVHEAGIPFAFSLTLSSTQLARSQDAPLLPVAYMVKMGVPRDVALAAVTATPAKLLEIETTHGSIAPKKRANLLIFDGDPLDPATQLKRVFVEGKSVYEN